MGNRSGTKHKGCELQHSSDSKNGKTLTFILSEAIGNREQAIIFTG